MLLCRSLDCFGILGVDDLSDCSQLIVPGPHFLDYFQFAPELFVFELAERDDVDALAGTSARLAILFVCFDVFNLVRRRTVAMLQAGVRESHYRQGGQ